jgi:hypothetical protein
VERSTPVILNTVRVERSIEASIRAQRRLSSIVSCPVNIVQRSGVVFNCIATVGLQGRGDGDRRKGHGVYVGT